jgi:hypothetical protein
MNKSYVISALLAVLALFALYHLEAPSPQPYSFKAYKQNYNKVYTRAGEEEYRKVIFLMNVAKMHEHNANPAHTWKMAINQFSDLTQP